MGSRSSGELSSGDFAASLRREAQLLLLCARVQLEPAHKARMLHLLEPGLDWTCLDELATRHGLVPLLYRHLGAVAPTAVPKARFASFWGRYEAASRRNQAMAAELADILRDLDANGIPAIPYKGPTLALRLYGDIGLREFGDLDVLVRPRDMPAARSLLQSRGYLPQYSLKPHLEAELLRSKRLYELPLVALDRGLIVELHWRTGPDFPVVSLDDDRWWGGLAAMSFQSGQVRALGARELLLILCLHGTKHFWGSLGWLVDVAELIRQEPRMDWEWIVAKAGSLACERRLGLGLYLAESLLGTPLPEVVRDIVRDQEVRKLGRELGTRLFAPDFRPMGILEALCLNLRLYASNRLRLRYAISMLFTPGPGEWIRWSLPRPLFFLYFPLRMGRLTGKYLLKPLQKA